MNRKLFTLGNRAILLLFNLFFFLTLYFAITSHNLVLGDNDYFGMSTTWVSLAFVIVTAALVISLLVFSGVRDFFKFIFVKHRNVTAWLLFGVVVLLQISFVYYFHPAIGFDAGAIHEALRDTTNPEIQAYYSLNSNNLPILLVQHWLTQIFSTDSWLFFDFVTLFLVDLSALLNILSVRIVERKKAVAAVYIHALWLLLFPMIIVPYTDTWVLPLVSAYILAYCVLAFGRVNRWIKGIAALGLGMSLAGAYFMKPSAVIAMIAIVLVELLYQLCRGDFRKVHFKKMSFAIGAFVLFLLAGAVTYHAGNTALNQQTYIQIDKERTNPPIHFISMGVSGEGGYNAKDALAMAQLPNRAARVDYSVRKLKERLKAKGFFGYMAFLVQKHSNNTADGTFAWVKEGHFIASVQPSAPNGRVSNVLKEFFYLYGKHIADFRFIAQVGWIILLVLIAFAWRDKRKMIQVLRLTLIGGFLFLLLFEGGRSRYLIQFLPAFLMLGALLYQTTIETILGFFKWNREKA